MAIAYISFDDTYADSEGHFNFQWDNTGGATDYQYQLRIVGDPWPTWVRQTVGEYYVTVTNLYHAIEIRVAGYYAPDFGVWEVSCVYTPSPNYGLGFVASSLPLANIALGHLGVASLESYDETSPEGLHVRRHWSLCRDALLRQRHWNFALQRAELDLVGQVDLTGIASTIGSASITVASATGLSVGKSIKANFVPRGTKITAIASLTITLDTTASVTGTGQTATAYTAPAFDYAYAYQLPTDYLLATEWNGREAGTGEAGYDIEGSTLLCDDDASKLRYVARVTDVSVWDANFQEAFALKLAARIAPGITTAQGLAEKLDQRAEQYFMKAFGPDNKETKPRAVMAQTSSGWLDAREGLDPRFR